MGVSQLLGPWDCGDGGGLAGELPLTLSSPLVACEGRGWELPFPLWPLAGRPFPTLVVKALVLHG